MLDRELTAIFENASVGIFITRESVVHRCNLRAAEIFGYRTPEELIGSPTAVVYPDTASFERMGREAGPVLASARRASPAPQQGGPRRHARVHGPGHQPDRQRPEVPGTNRRFFELLDFPDSLVAPGTPFAAFIRHNVERGDHGPATLKSRSARA